MKSEHTELLLSIGRSTIGVILTLILIDLTVVIDIKLQFNSSGRASVIWMKHSYVDHLAGFV